MNYPIYNSDFKFTLEEIYRYLKFFDGHIVYLSTSKHPIDQNRGITAESFHQFRDDGLVIKLEWKVNLSYFHQKYTNMSQLIKSHKKGDYSLLNYSIHEYSKKHNRQSTLPNDETYSIFFDKVIRNRAKASYTKEEYKRYEHPDNLKTAIPDILFTFLIEENNNILEFEKYYENRKKERKKEQ